MPENLYCPGAIEIRFLLVFRDPAAVNLKAEAAFRCGHEKHLRPCDPCMARTVQVDRDAGVFRQASCGHASSWRGRGWRERQCDTHPGSK